MPVDDLAVELPKDEVKDRQGRQVRTSYGQWLRRPPSAIDAIYLEYLGKDAIAHGACIKRSNAGWGGSSIRATTPGASFAGTGSTSRVASRGPQTHHIQVKAAVSCRLRSRRMVWGWTSNDGMSSLRCCKSSGTVCASVSGPMVSSQGRDSSKVLQAILSRFERSRSGLLLRRTETGKYATDAGAFGELVDEFPFVAMLLQFRTIDKLLGAFLDKMAKPVMHPSFNVLARTGRTTSFGEINSQNLPRDNRIRSCFVPSPGHVFVVADFKTIEMATLAKACISQFGLISRMGEAINAGKDLHTLVAQWWTGQVESEVTARNAGWWRTNQLRQAGRHGQQLFPKMAEDFNTSST